MKRIATTLKLLCTIVALAAVLLSCSQAAQQQLQLAAPQQASAAEPGGLSRGLPAPSEVLRPRRSSYLEEQLCIQPEDYQRPYARVEANEGGTLMFMPDYINDSSEISGLACATYQFTVLGYDRAPIVRLSWKDGNAPAEYWIGISQWGKDRWQFYRGTQNGRVGIGDFDPYFDLLGNCLVTVVLPGTEPFILDEVRLGNLPPHARISASPVSGPAPLSVSLDGSASTMGDNDIVSYEWDFEGDGSYDLDTNTTAQAEHVYTEAGIFHASLRVTDSIGLSSVTSTKIEVDRNWQRSFGVSGPDRLRDIVAASDGGIYVCGSLYDPELSNVLLLARLDEDGELLWARHCRLDAHLMGQKICVDDQGDLLLLARWTDLGFNTIQPVLQKWDSAGQLVWSRIIDVDGRSDATGLIQHAGSSFISGVASGNGNRSFACRVDAEGDQVWARMSSQDDPANGALSSTLISPLFEEAKLGLTGYVNAGGTVIPALMELGLDGSAWQSRLLEISGGSGLNSLTGSLRFASYYDDGLAEPALTLVGSLGAMRENGLNAQGVFALNIAYQNSSAGGQAYFADYMILGDAGPGQPGRLLLCGTDQDAGGWLLELSTVDLASLNALGFAGDEAYGLFGAGVYGEGMLLCGDMPNADPIFSEFSPEQTALNFTWEESEVTLSIANFSFSELPVEVVDALPALTLDTGAGGSDAYVALISDAGALPH